MRTSSELLLTFLLNAVWQIALIAAVASFGAWLLRHSAMRYQHRLWVAALSLSLLVPVVTALRSVQIGFPASGQLEVINPVLADETVPFESPSTSVSSWSFKLSENFVLALATVYGVFLLYRTFKLLQAWSSTRKVRKSAVLLEGDEAVEAIVQECAKRLDFNSDAVSVSRSPEVAVPVTIGLFRPVIILPESLLRAGDKDLLTSAIGHEFIHVARRDYVLNFLYELLFLPVSSHPAAGLTRRRIKQTRELVCDELVAERILNAEIYARSLVALASSAPPLRRLSVTTTVGIADADILEARIMSLLSKPKPKRRWTKLLLLIVSMLLLVPSFAAAAFAMRFELTNTMQDPAQQEKETVEKKKEEVRWREVRSEQEFKERLANDPKFREEVQRKEEKEMQMRAVKQAALLRLARLSMDQAIQIATSQTPGKVLECSLNGERWEEPGKLAKDGYVFYHVVIADENNPGATHVLVNAVDGTIIRSEKEIPRRRQP